jgi:hypothetical protein
MATTGGRAFSHHSPDPGTPRDGKKEKEPLEGRQDGSKQGNPVVFFIVSVLGALFLLAEAVLQAGGRSLCVAEGCGLVISLARFGDLSIILAGLAALALLGLLSALNLRRRRGLLDFGINLLLIAALAAEGFFLGYQTFWLAERCLICLGVFGIFFALGLLRLLEG